MIPPHRLFFAPLLGLALATLQACGDGPGGDAGEEGSRSTADASPAEPEIDRRLGLSANAKLENHDMGVRALAEPRHPADGGGRAWIESVENADGEATTLRAGETARIRLVYEAGPLGVAAGGSVVFQVSPFFGWDPPQNLDASRPGYTEVTSPVIGLEPVVEWPGDQSLRIGLPVRALASGEHLFVTYGAGPELARVDALAERDAHLWFGVDGDGDGFREWIAEPPAVDIGPGPPARVLIVVPTTAAPGAEFPVRVSVLDRLGNTGVPFEGEVRLDAPAGLELPEKIPFAPEHAGRRKVTARAASAGVFRITATAVPREPSEPFFAGSNPIVVESNVPPIYWADLHGHSQLSDGTGTPEDYFLYARDVAGLDAVALTEHDHWGLRALDTTPEMWERIRAANARFDTPGEFVTVLGYEWTSWLHGHRHVLYFRGEGEVLSSLDPRYQTPTQLWDALRGSDALTFAHHSAGAPIATNWNYRPDPVLEPVTEIVSAHGSSEAPDSRATIRDPVPGNFVRDVLDSGLRLGFIGSGDSHDGHPGEPQLASPFSGGLAAIAAAELSREGILTALRERRVYASNGARIFLGVSLDGAGMGSLIAADDGAVTDASGRGAPEASLRVRVEAEAPLERIDFVRSGEVSTVGLEGQLTWSSERTVPRLAAGEYLYVRAIQQNGGTVWSSPIYAE